MHPALLLYGVWFLLLVILVVIGVTVPSWFLVLPIVGPLAAIGVLTVAAWLARKLGI